MNWTDEGIVLGARRHGEASAILELMTREHGRHLGLVRGGAGTRLAPLLQPGNTVRATWRARLDEHLGNFTVEALDLRAGSFFSAAHAVYGVTYLAALCRLLPERDPHAQVFAALSHVIARLDVVLTAAPIIVRFELNMLRELGFGLDLATCAVTGARADLAYVSPKSGRAVGLVAGEPWRARLLRLPAFLRADAEDGAVSTTDVIDGFALTGFFVSRHVLEPRSLVMPVARERFIAIVAGAAADVA
ncbi:MAG: DNA repair protein RecO [Proteobacteria bacterium]|nr:DNA repair protein RecO [Pseudomonadota bacterium]